MEVNVKLTLEEINTLLEVLTNRNRREKADWKLILKVDRAHGRLTRKMKRAETAGAV